MSTSAEPDAGVRLPRWVVAWFVVTALIQTYDACYELLGPLSHAGGRLAALWPGHVFYSRFDHRYAGFDAFGSAQSWANLLEVVVLVCALALSRRAAGVVLGLVVSVATFWKTVIYFLVEISSGLEMTRQSLESGDLAGFLLVAVLPNLVWVVVPLAVVVALGRRLVRAAGGPGRARLPAGPGPAGPATAPVGRHSAGGPDGPDGPAPEPPAGP